MGKPRSLFTHDFDKALTNYNMYSRSMKLSGKGW